MKVLNCLYKVGSKHLGRKSGCVRFLYIFNVHSLLWAAIHLPNNQPQSITFIHSLKMQDLKQWNMQPN